jgi:predicted ATP-binding protein involved in virulence
MSCFPSCGTQLYVSYVPLFINKGKYKEREKCSVVHSNPTSISLLSMWTNNVRDSRECNGTLVFLITLLVHVARVG